MRELIGELESWKTISGVGICRHELGETMIAENLKD